MPASTCSSSVTPRVRVAVWRIVLGNVIAFLSGLALSVLLWAPLPIVAVIASLVGAVLGFLLAAWSFTEVGR